MDEDDPYVVAIDVPGGPGKGSLALLIVKILGFHLLYSGVVYLLPSL